MTTVDVPANALRALLAFYDAWMNTATYEPLPEQIEAGMASLLPIADSWKLDEAGERVEPHLSVLRAVLEPA